MIKIEIAHITIGIDNKFNYLERLCRDYLDTTTQQPELVVAVSMEEILAEQACSENKFSLGYCESVCICRSIYQKMVYRQAFFLHAAAVTAEDKAWLFCGKSGVGKSTHVGLWKQLLGNKTIIINGDKPIIRLYDGKFYACGTPWAGKEGWQCNMQVPVGGVCFLEQADKNAIARITAGEAVERILLQVLLPEKLTEMDRLLKMIGDFIAQIPAYLLRCNMELQAAKVSYEALTGNTSMRGAEK